MACSSFTQWCVKRYLSNCSLHWSQPTCFSAVKACILATHSEFSVGGADDESRGKMTQAIGLNVRLTTAHLNVNFLRQEFHPASPTHSLLKPFVCQQCPNDQSSDQLCDSFCDCRCSEALFPFNVFCPVAWCSACDVMAARGGASSWIP